MPSLTAGTFAIALSKGSEEDTAHGGYAGTNKVAIFSPTGVETDIADDVELRGRRTVGHLMGRRRQPARHREQLAVPQAAELLQRQRSRRRCKRRSTPAAQSHVLVAASADGHVAVAWVTQFGYMQVQIYANHAGATAPTPVFGPIPYNGTTTSCGSTYIYGNGTTIVNALRWLSNTKLLVAVQSNNSGTPTAKNGLLRLRHHRTRKSRPGSTTSPARRSQRPRSTRASFTSTTSRSAQLSSHNQHQCTSVKRRGTHELTLCR